MRAPLCCRCMAGSARNLPFGIALNLTMSRMQRRGFKSYKQIVKVYYRMGKTEEMLVAYRFLPDLCAPKILQRSAGPEVLDNVNQDCCC